MPFSTSSMHRMLALLVLVALGCDNCANAADPISDKTGRYSCIHRNESDPNPQKFDFPLLTVDLNSVQITLSNGTGEVVSNYDLQNSTEFLKSKGICVENLLNDTYQEFTLKLDGNNFFQMHFTGNNTNYRMSRLVYGNSENGQTEHFVLDKPDLKLAGNEFKPGVQGYKCANLALSLSSTTEASQKKKANIELGDFMFFAFEKGVDTKDVTRLECRKDPGSSLIPMIVGAGLLAFAVVVIIIYFVRRDKSTPADKS